MQINLLFFKYYFKYFEANVYKYENILRRDGLNSLKSISRLQSISYKHLRKKLNKLIRIRYPKKSFPSKR